jgi:hypothetical protein
MRKSLPFLVIFLMIVTVEVFFFALAMLRKTVGGGEIQLPSETWPTVHKRDLPFFIVWTEKFLIYRGPLSIWDIPAAGSERTV